MVLIIIFALVASNIIYMEFSDREMEQQVTHMR